MQKFKNGEYLGKNSFERKFNSLIITQNSCQENYNSAWHYHSNPYFALILRGGSLERRKEKNIECTPGLLLFYNTHEPHKNEQYLPGSKNFNIEFESSWFKNMHLDERMLEGDIIIKEPVIKSLFLKIISEVIEEDCEMQLSVETSILQCFSILKKDNKQYIHPPTWLIQIKELLSETTSHSYSLSDLSVLFGVHPVTISKLFPRFFTCTMGEYIRKVKIEKSLQFLSKRNMSLASISALCDFADHGHFTRVFKKHTGFTPSQYRELLSH
jgi:AraC family transcriptional regulator